jgi:hypothetical protein
VFAVRNGEVKIMEERRPVAHSQPDFWTPFQRTA